MKLIKNKEFLQQIAHQIDVLNTLGGGISLPQVKIDKQEKGAIIRVSIPAVSPEAYHIALDQNQLTIIAAHRFEEDSNSLIPLFSQQFTLPPQVDLSRIDAVYEVQELQVRLPYHTSVYKTRNIDITIKD
ncbi:Hsp20/alpha crystallin family protein [Adhaeribacter pallidiroseus]|nr:Hsp20/alpha crystallin family protein [Adhaeribacter pallidiroseus]